MFLEADGDMSFFIWDALIVEIESESVNLLEIPPEPGLFRAPPRM